MYSRKHDCLRVLALRKDARLKLTRSEPYATVVTICYSMVWVGQLEYSTCSIVPKVESF